MNSGNKWIDLFFFLWQLIFGVVFILALFELFHPIRLFRPIIKRIKWFFVVRLEPWIKKCFLHGLIFCKKNFQQKCFLHSLVFCKKNFQQICLAIITICVVLIALKFLIRGHHIY